MMDLSKMCESCRFVENDSVSQRYNKCSNLEVISRDSFAKKEYLAARQLPYCLTAREICNGDFWEAPVPPDPPRKVCRSFSFHWLPSKQGKVIFWLWWAWI